MIYQPLDVSRFEARLLRLLDIPSNPLEPPRFETITCSLIRPPEYVALSYCWGDDTQKLPIEVNGETLYVTKNLATALRHSEFHPGALIWVDAICINQHDVNEKAHQIRLMGLIYSKARATAVWLGNEEQDTQYARTFLEEISLDDDGQQSLISNDKFTTALENTRNSVRSLRGLHELLTRPYWERVWIIQEIAKARTVSVRCGSLCFDLSSVIASTEHVDDLPERSRILISTIQEFRLQESEARRGGLRMTLLQALIRSRHSLATNPRDKVYALLNLARDGNDLVPTPTYSEPIEDVFRELTMTFLQSPHPMETTLLSSRASLKAKSSAQPSWAVDWSDLAFNMPHWLTSNLPVRFNGLLTERGFGTPTFSSDSVKLCGQGQSLGFVDSVGDMSGEIAIQLPHEELQKSVAVMGWVASELCRLLVPESPRSMAASCTELTVALVDIITNTDTLNTRSGKPPYIKELSRHLGDLVVNSFPIRAWAKGYLDYEEVPRPNKSITSTTLKSYFMNTKRFGLLQFPSGHLRQRFISSRLSISAFQVWDDAFATLDLSPEYGLKFAICEGHIVIVPHATQTRDIIFRLDSCYFPIVLREVAGKAQSTYKIIGETCIGIDTNRQWFAARDCPWTIKHPLEKLDLLA
ncbi:HET-domain-containing protein [Annulohypoxylon moriforme]|nr:HET-domain-containing protein [Annulohypoxylon moriforme]